MKRPGQEPTGDELDPALEAAYDAMEAGRPDEALVEAARSPDAAGRALLECGAFIELGMLKAAHGALTRAASELGEDDLDVVELTGEIALAAWDFDTARTAFERVAHEEEDAGILERLALLADHRGEPAEADRHLARARALLAATDPLPGQGAGSGQTASRGPVPMPDDAFDQVVAHALESLRSPFREHLANVRIVREPLPFRELIDPDDPAATPPDVLGLFVGPTIVDSSGPAGAHAMGVEFPPTIYLFKRNLERATTSHEELAEEIRITLFHEIGHLLGLDEDEVAGMGLA